jgi:hypothetical protein
LGCNSFAQSVISEDKDIIQFLKQMKEIEDGYRCSVFAVNLLTFKGFSEKDQCGLYRIGAHVSHTSNHLMWWNDGRKYFIDCEKKLDDILQEIFTLWKESKCIIPDSEKLLYIEQILRTFKNNQIHLQDIEPGIIKVVENIFYNGPNSFRALM